MFKHRTFVKILQCILVFLYVIVAISIIQEVIEPIMRVIMALAFFTILIIMIEISIGDWIYMSYKAFVKIIQCILVFLCYIIASAVMKENPDPLIQFLLCIFTVLIIVIELFRGDDL